MLLTAEDGGTSTVGQDTKRNRRKKRQFTIISRGFVTPVQSLTAISIH